MGFPRQEYWSGLPFPTLGDLLDPGIQPASPAFAGGLCITEPHGKFFIRFWSAANIQHEMLKCAQFCV